MTIDPQDDARLVLAGGIGLMLLCAVLLASCLSWVTPEKPPATGSTRCFIGVAERPTCIQLHPDNSGGLAECDGTEPACCSLTDAGCLEVVR